MVSLTRNRFRIPLTGTDWEKTSLKPYVDILNQHTSRLVEKTRLEKRAEGDYFCFAVLPSGC